MIVGDAEVWCQIMVRLRPAKLIKGRYLSAAPDAQKSKRSPWAVRRANSFGGARLRLEKPIKRIPVWSGRASTPTERSAVYGNKGPYLPAKSTVFSS